MSATSLQYRSIWKLTYPVMLGMLAQNLINFTDTVFLGWVGEVELGASAIGGLFYYGVFTVGFGFSIGAQILISRRNGEGRYRDIGSIFNHSLLFLMLLAVLMVVFVQGFAPGILRKTLASPAVYDAAWTFLDVRIWGVFFAFINANFRSFYVGILKTRFLGWSAAIMAVVNIILNYLLIFGNFGFPRMGIAGSALASVIAEGVSVVFFIVLTFRKRRLDQFGILVPGRLQLRVIGQTLNLSVFTMIQNFLAMGGWLFFFMVIEQLGQHQLAISNIARSIYIMLMIPLWAFGTTTNTLISNLIGEGRYQDVGRAIKRIIIMSFSITLGLALLSSLFPTSILRLYTSDPALIHDSKPVLYVVFTALLFFSVVSMGFNAVTATGNTLMGMLIETITILAYCIFVYEIAIVFRQPVEIAWFSEYVYFFFMGLFSFAYLKFGNWRKIKI